jgi:hypothetical protein
MFKITDMETAWRFEAASHRIIGNWLHGNYTEK